MLTALRVECWKARRRGLWLTCAALLGVEILWLLRAYRSPDVQALTLGWLDILYNMPLLNGILVPVIAGTLASRIADLEHKGSTLKLLETLQPVTQLFHAKLLLGTAYLAVLTVLQSVLLLVMGFSYGFYGSPDPVNFLHYGLFTFTSCFAVYLLHLVLSLRVKNQMVPLCIGLGGSFAALLLMFLPWQGARLLCGPYGFFGALSFVYMTYWDPDTRVMELTRVPSDWAAYAVLLVWIAVIYLAGRTALKRKEL